jgi:LPS export ABC transporter protein LptC
MVSPRNIRLVLALLVVTAVVGIVVAIFFNSSRKGQPEPVTKQLRPNIDVVMHNANFSEMRDGVTVWELSADTAEYDKTGDMAYLNGVHMECLNSRSHGTIIVTSTKGEYSNSTKNILLRGKVHVVTESGMVFDTVSLDYLAAPSQFRTSERVDFHHERLSLAAIGMELNVNEEKARFFKTVDAVVEGVQPK